MGQYGYRALRARRVSPGAPALAVSEACHPLVEKTLCPFVDIRCRGPFRSWPVSRILSCAAICLAGSVRDRACALRPTWISPGRVVDPAWPCTGRGLPGRRVTATPVRSTAPFHPCLFAPHVLVRHRRCVSVALSRGFPRVGVTHRPRPVVSGLSSRDTSRDYTASPRSVGSAAGCVNVAGADDRSMAERIVRGACPHDCPDTCAMLTTVDAGGRAVAIGGDPDHPITAGFLCGKVSNYLDRVYSDERILQPLIRAGDKGAGEFRRASWDEALDAAAAGLRERDRRARRRVGPAVQLHGHAGHAPGRLDRQPLHERDRRHRARAHDLRQRRDRRRGRDPRALAGGRSRGVAARPLPARLGLEPDVDRAASLEEAPRRAPRRRAAVRRRPVPQPHGPGRRRAPAPAAGHRRRAGDGDDARGRRRRPRRRGVVPRPRRRLRRAA